MAFILRRTIPQFLCVVHIIAGFSLGYAANNNSHRALPVSTLWQPTSTRININNISTTNSNDGWSDRVRGTGNSGLFFPKVLSRTAVFQSGFVWGAKKIDSLHVGGATFSVGLQPGKILSPGHAEDPNLPKNRIYRVRPDYATADLSTEAGEEGISPEEVRAQYALDWSQWPAPDGAPYLDRNSNGLYEPDIDIPGVKGAHQSVWYVSNDLDTSRTLALYGTYPLGFEMQLTLWSYANAGALDNIIYKRYVLINKSDASFDSMYVCQWSDPDLGDAGDDYAGCDTTLDLTYAYNGGPVDYIYSPFTPPAVGFRLIGTRATAAFYFAAGQGYSDPPFSYEGALQWYNLLQGLTPIDGSPFIHPLFPGQPTTFWLDGDPVTGTGRIDGFFDAPGDRRMGICAGPTQLAAGDTQEIVVAVVAATGASHVLSVDELRGIAHSAQTNYSALQASSLPILQTQVEYPNSADASVHVLADCRSAGALSVEIFLRRHDGSLISNFLLFDDGLHGDSMAADGIWGSTTTVPREPEGLHANVTLTDSSNQTVYWERLAEEISTAGPVIIELPRIFSDNINSNGEVNPGENIRYGFSITNLSAFALSEIGAFSQTGDIKFIRFGSLSTGESDSLVYQPNDSTTYFAFNAPDSGSISIPFVITDVHHNRWLDTVRFEVVPFPAPILGSLVNHVAGISEWEFNVLVLNSSTVNNHTYQISVVDSIDSARTKGFTLRDVATGGDLLLRHPLPDEFGHNIPVTDGFKVMRGQVFGHVGLMRDSTRWISTSPPWLRGFRFTFDPHSAYDGGATTGYQLGIFYLGHLGSSFDPYRSFPVEIRFDASNLQKAYRLRRSGAYLIQSADPFVDVPFSVWDVTDRTNQRQLTLTWRDQNNSSTWDPVEGSDGVEVVFVYNKTYDPTGSTQFSMPPNAIPDECTVGPNADIVYGLSLAVVTGHILNESPGNLYLRPTLALNSSDQFTFNPTIILGVRNNEMPTTYQLMQNFPNPFNPSTTIRYQLPVASRVTIRLYNILGQQVRTLVDAVQEAGFTSVQWNGTNDGGSIVASGVYFYRLEAGTYIEQKKMLVLR